MTPNPSDARSARSVLATTSAPSIAVLRGGRALRSRLSAASTIRAHRGFEMAVTVHERHDVVVIGAGLAGLTAAHALQAQGLDVLVLEAQERVGGRVHSMRQLGGVGEAGGTYIGAGYARVIAAASRLKIRLIDVTPVLEFFREQDLVLDGKIIRPVRLARASGQSVSRGRQEAFSLDLSPRADDARKPVGGARGLARSGACGARRFDARMAYVAGLERARDRTRLRHELELRPRRPRRLRAAVVVPRSVFQGSALARASGANRLHGRARRATHTRSDGRRAPPPRLARPRRRRRAARARRRSGRVRGRHAARRNARSSRPSRSAR